MTNQNKTPLLLLCVLLVFLSIPVIAQDQAPEITWYDYESVDLRALNKVTAQTTNFKAKIGQTVKFGEVFIKVQACRKPPAIEKQESASFLQIWEKDKALDKSKWIFSGWMFASSPALSAMDHPIYDVWVTGCSGKSEAPVDVPSTEISESDGDNATLDEDRTVSELISDLVGEDITPDTPVTETVPQIETIEEESPSLQTTPVEGGTVQEILDELE